MKAQQIKKATKNNTFENATYIIENSGLELVLIQNLGFSKMWEVKNNTEITHITNTLKDLVSNQSDVKFTFA